MRRRVISIILIIFLIILGFAWHGFQSHFSRPKHLKSSATSVIVAKATKMNFPITVKSVGTLQANEAINVSSTLSGLVTAVYYQPGSWVKKNTPLIQLENRTYQSKVNSDKADVGLKKVQYARAKWALKKGALAQADVDLAAANYQEALAMLATDQANVDSTTIRAAFSGYVGPKNVNIGDYLQVGTPLTTLTDRQNLLVNYAFPEQYVTQLKLGQTIIINVDSQAGKTYEGKVNYISPTVDVNTHSVALQADISNINNILSPGLFVRIKQNLGEIASAIVIPQQAIIPTITGSQVYVVRNKKAYSVQVETGPVYKDKMQITKGINEGDLVIIVGQSEVHSGSPIKEVQ
jgi:membrane fusion protein (multidrug efflux system)